MKRWNTLPEQRKSSLLKEYPGTAKLVSDISSAKSDFVKILATTDPIIRQFVEDFAIPLNAAIKPYAGTPSTLSKVAGAVWDAMCDAPDELGRLLVPGYEAWADGGSGEEIVSSACGDIALTVCGGKVIKVVGKGLKKFVRRLPLENQINRIYRRLQQVFARLGDKPNKILEKCWVKTSGIR